MLKPDKLHSGKQHVPLALSVHSSGGSSLAPRATLWQISAYFCLTEVDKGNVISRVFGSASDSDGLSRDTLACSWNRVSVLYLRP